jgi:cAMP phosphodiesterase
MRDLEQAAGLGKLRGFPVVITHIKPGGDQEAVIRRELAADNPLGLRLIFPEQGKRIDF